MGQHRTIRRVVPRSWTARLHRRRGRVRRRRALLQGGRAVATAGFPPLWPALLAVVDKLGADGDRAFELTGAVLGAGTIALTGLVGRRVAGPRIGLVAAALVAVCPALIAADGSLMSGPSTSRS